MVAAYDLGDMGSPYPPAHVHYRNKTEVGRRLAMMLLHVQYALQWPAGGLNDSTYINWRGPVPTVASNGGSGSAIVVSFATLDGAGLFLNDTQDCWECCGAAQDTFQV
jgi:hypothetical protein